MQVDLETNEPNLFPKTCECGNPIVNKFGACICSDCKCHIPRWSEKNELQYVLGSIFFISMVFLGKCCIQHVYYILV